MKIEIEVSEKNECTAHPWWIIIDPKQNFATKNGGVSNIAHMITGPFFSRESAQSHLEGRNYAFSKNASVYCHSGHWSHEYKSAINDAEKKCGHRMGDNAK